MRRRIGNAALTVAAVLLFWMGNAEAIAAYPGEFARGWHEAGSQQAAP